jgi:hypothetical protein
MTVDAVAFGADGLPAFYAAVPTITLRDPLAELLGAARGGLLTYGYADAVRLAGHSCPTVAAAYGLTRRALMQLYGSALPERGAIAVSFASTQDEGVAGVMGAVAGMLTGAAGTGGFKGLGGRYARRNLLRYGESQPIELRFTRRDNGAAVDATSNLVSVPPDPRTGALLGAILGGTADTAEVTEFAALWQERVRRILLEHADDPNVFVVSEVS